MGFFIRLLVTFLHMQTYLDGVLRVILLVHLVLELHISCGWRMDVNFSTWSVGDDFLKVIHSISMMLDLMETLSLVMLLKLVVVLMF